MSHQACGAVVSLRFDHRCLRRCSRGRRDDWEFRNRLRCIATWMAPVCLLAEDNEINQMVASELLQQAGAVCEIAGDGKQALERVLAKKFDFILMDCQMPGDGRHPRPRGECRAKPRQAPGNSQAPRDYRSHGQCD